MQAALISNDNKNNKDIEFLTEKVIMDTDKKIVIFLLSIPTLGLAYVVNKIIQDYRFATALLHGTEKEIQIAKNALKWGASNYLVESDLIRNRSRGCVS